MYEIIGIRDLLQVTAQLVAQQANKSDESITRGLQAFLQPLQNFADVRLAPIPRDR